MLAGWVSTKTGQGQMRGSGAPLTLVGERPLSCYSVWLRDPACDTELKAQTAVYLVMVPRSVPLARIAWVVGVMTASVIAPQAYAAEVNMLHISQSGDSYRISFEAVVNAPARRVYEMLADYGRLDQLSPVIVAISVEPTPNGHGERVRSVLKSCIAFICREIKQVEDVTEPDAYTIVATVVPGQSDFKGGHCVWHIADEGSRTRLHYEATRTIGFWVPGLIGPWLIKRTMHEHLTSSVAELERLINQNAEPRR
jgi:hypothetical protein